ncbi:MAG: HD domain-containing phosphohydrolase [Candidatus Eisenbacteria bacterium]
MNDRILVCDDDPGVCGVLSRLLAREGFQVRTVECGEQALEEIALHPPDLLLLDVTMPGMSGFDVARAVRRLEGGALLPIALITGLADTASRVLGLASGADEFVDKPFETQVLVARIHAMLRVKHLTDQLENTENVIFTLARTVEARDSCTDLHLWRLAEYSRAISLAMGCSPEEARYAWYGGILHDIGKIGLSENVLKKKGALTPAEFLEVHRHPDIGAEIIRSMRFAPIVSPIVRGHHERWDGKGYPQGLEGEAIPLAARIVAVADAWDAMTTNRPYRLALDEYEAISRLKQGAGSQWDPAVVSAFLELQSHGELPEARTASPRQPA